MLIFNHRKAVQALNYFALKEGGEINVMKAIKLIWLSDRLHLRTYCRPIFNDTYYAMEYGPVASATKDLAMGSDPFLSDDETKYRSEYLESIDSYSFKSIKAADLLVFSKSETEVFESVYNEFGGKNKFELSVISHKYPEWFKHKEMLDNNVPRVAMDFNDFFEDTNINVPDFFDDEPEIINICKELYQQPY